MSNNITFIGSLPQSRFGSKRSDGWGSEIVPELIANPAQWVRINAVTDRRAANRLAGRIRSGCGAWYASTGRFEAAVRSLPDGEVWLCARYLPDYEAEVA